MKNQKCMELNKAQRWARSKIMWKLAKDRLYQKDLAKMMGISQARLSKVLNHPEKISCATIWLICDYFDYEPMPIIVRRGLGR